MLFLAMFAVLGWHDLRTRQIDDRLFLMFGGAGAVLYAFDWQDYAVLLVLCTASAAVMLWRLKAYGTADMFAMIAGAVIYPAYAGFMPTMLMVFIGAIVFGTISVVGGNVLLNISDALTRGRIFGDMSDSRTRKCLAFFLVHRQRGFDKHSFLAESSNCGRRRLKLGHKSVNQEFAGLSTDRYVECAPPFITFAAVSAFLVVAAAYAYQW